MLYKPKNVKIILIILLIGESFLFFLSPMSAGGFDEAKIDVDQDELFSFDDLLAEPEKSDLETPEFSKISITFLEFASYVGEETIKDPIITSLVMFQKFAEFEIKEAISTESYETYRNNVEISGNSLITDPQGSPDELIIPLVKLEADKTGNILPRIEADIPKSVFLALENSSFVRAIDDVNSITFQFSNDILDWGVDYIDAEKIWNGTENGVDIDSSKPSGEDIKVAILDSGIDTNHEDLTSFNPVNSWNFVDDNSNVTDDYGHGTHVAGIIAAQDNNIGVIGVAPNV